MAVLFNTQLMQWVTDFVSEYSSIAEEIVVTQSVEGRDIKAIKVQNGTETSENKL